MFCFLNFTNAKNTGCYWKFPGKHLTLQWIDLSCLSVIFLNSVFLTFMSEQFCILSSWSCLKWNLRRTVFGIEKAILEQSVLKYWKNHTSFWSIKWKVTISKKHWQVWGFQLCVKACQSRGESLCWFRWGLDWPCKGKRLLHEKREVLKLRSHKLISLL